jgi:hypothetical protein
MSFQKKSIVGEFFFKNGIFDKLFSQRNFALNEKNCKNKLSCACCQVIAVNNYDDFQHWTSYFYNNSHQDYLMTKLTLSQ